MATHRVQELSTIDHIEVATFHQDLRKLIKYEERLGTNANKNDYFDSLFQRTTASFRAKQDKENVAANMKGKPDQKKFYSDENNIHSEQKKTSLEQKKGEKEQKFKKNKENRKVTIPAQLPSQPIPAPPPTKKSMQALTSPPTAVSHRKVLREIPFGPPAEANRRELKEPNNWFYIDDDDNNNVGKSKTRKPTSPSKGRSSRSKSPKSAKPGITGKLLDDLKEPLWEGQSMSSRSRSHSTGRNRPEPSPKALSTGGIQKKRRSQSSDRPSDFRTYTARSLGAMVPQPRLNRGNRSGVNDPVKLYHYYQREWKYFEKQIPGVLTRADIRWQIRQKLLDPQ